MSKVAKIKIRIYYLFDDNVNIDPNNIKTEEKSNKLFLYTTK